MSDPQKAVYEQPMIKQDRRLENGTRKLLEMLEDKKRGRVSFYLDGSGKISELEIVNKE